MSWEGFTNVERRLGLWRRGMVALAGWMVIECQRLSFAYMATLGTENAAVIAAGAAAVTALQAPVALWAGFVCRWYFTDKRSGAPPA